MLVTTVSEQVAGKVAQVTMFLAQVPTNLVQVTMILAQVRKKGNDLRHSKNTKG